jgi:circadian clock protein KaiC
VRNGEPAVRAAEITDSYTDLRFSPQAVSFMTNDIILQRYVEIDSQRRRVMTVVKARNRPDSA